MAAAVLCLPVQAELEEPWTLSKLASEFGKTNTLENHVCLLHDGWQLAFFSDDNNRIGAFLISERAAGTRHQHGMERMVQRLVKLIGLRDAEMMEFEDRDSYAALVINRGMISEMAENAEHVLAGSPLVGVAYLLENEYFYINDLKPNGYLHWKTIKKSGVELLMPMGPPQLTALEIVGRQFMDEFACNVLARKLGFGGNTASNARRRSLSQEMGVFSIPYMNTSSEVIAAHSKDRVLFGKKQTVNHMFANRYGSTLLYPAQGCDWPDPQKTAPEPQVVEQPKEPVKVEVKPLTPAEAREAYSEYLKNL